MIKLAIAVILFTSILSAPIQECSQQGQCIRLVGATGSNKECVTGNREVCLSWDNQNGLCVKDVTTTVSHMCLPGKKNQPWASSVPYCQVVPAGNWAEFVVKDGKGCLGSTATLTSPVQTTCAPGPAGFCGDSGKSDECLWRFKTDVCPSTTGTAGTGVISTGTGTGTGTITTGTGTDTGSSNTGTGTGNGNGLANTGTGTGTGSSTGTATGSTSTTTTTTATYSPPINVCQDQGDCLTASGHEAGAPCDGSGRKYVCIQWGKPSCLKSTTSSVNLVCGGVAGRVARWTASSPYCQLVTAGASAFFSINDGGLCSNSTGLPYTLPSGFKCTAQNVCGTEDACKWEIPTSPLCGGCPA